MKNTFSDALINNAGTRLDGDQLVLDVRLPWYRSMPLSVVEFAELTLDGQAVPLDAAELELNGQRWPLQALAGLTGESWFVLDSALLHVSLPARPKQAVQASLLFKLYPPYIPMLTWVTRGQALLAA